MHTLTAIYLIGFVIAFISLALNQILIVGESRAPLPWAVAICIFWPVAIVVFALVCLWAILARDWSH